MTVGDRRETAAVPGGIRHERGRRSGERPRDADREDHGTEISLWGVDVLAELSGWQSEPTSASLSMRCWPWSSRSRRISCGGHNCATRPTRWCSKPPSTKDRSDPAPKSETETPQIFKSGAKTIRLPK